VGIFPRDPSRAVHIPITGPNYLQLECITRSEIRPRKSRQLIETGCPRAVPLRSFSGESAKGPIWSWVPADSTCCAPAPAEKARDSVAPNKILPLTFQADFDMGIPQLASMRLQCARPTPFYFGTDSRNFSRGDANLRRTALK
jgi:hypothetical protein